MIKYVFNILRDEKIEIKKYVPKDIPKELPDIVYIEGPNSCGKSTLLNLIALGFYGLNPKSEINPSLKDKLKNLLSAKHQKIDFKIEIDNKFFKTKLISEKENINSEDINLYEIESKSSKPLSAEKFFKEYKLIYDIPENPTERLEQLVEEIAKDQANIGDKIGYFKDFVKSTISDIKDSKDTIKIENLKTIILESKNKKSEIEKENVETKSDLDDLKKLKLLKEYRELNQELNFCSGQIKKFENTKNKFKNSLYKETKKFNELYEQVKTLQKTLSKYFNEIKVYLETKYKNSSKLFKNKCDILNELNFQNILEDPKGKDKIIIDEADYFVDVFTTELNNFEQKGTTKEAELFKSIIKILENYKSTAIKIPELNISVLEFIEILNKNVKTFEIDLYQKENLERYRNMFIELAKIFTNYINIHKDMVREKENYDYGIKKIDVLRNEEQEYNRFNNQKNALEKDLNKIVINLENIGIKEDQIDYIYRKMISSETDDKFIELTIPQLKTKINSLEGDLINQEKNINNYNLAIKIDEKELEKIESKEVHQYADDLNIITIIFNRLNVLEQKIKHTFQDYINNIRKKTKTDSTEAEIY
jgi:DNA repair protein SbcC/Rad50